MLWRRKPFTVTRHFYTSDSNNYEQSLDIYRPLETRKEGHEELPLVVLVVGSAWIGHRALAYRPTSWWNSSGPASIATEGCVCVCVRHRGAFVQPPSASAIGVLTTVFALMLQLSSSALSIVAFAVLLLALALHPLAKGAATHEEMLQDVASALKWVRSNKSLVSNRLVFGGYSSGAHVAAALLTRPDVLAAKGLPAADKLCDGVLLLSGVLGVRDGPPLPPVDARWARQVPHLIMRLVFAEAAATLPSPVHCIRDAPALPHLLIFCEHELFNLQPIERSMGIMFSSETYAAQLTARGIKVKQITVHSDHWAVLDSAGFRQALRAAFVESRWPS